ncbi:unnamed protein product, partial [Closterium sp. NIES-54]
MQPLDPQHQRAEPRVRDWVGAGTGPGQGRGRGGFGTGQQRGRGRSETGSEPSSNGAGTGSGPGQVRDGVGAGAGPGQSRGRVAASGAASGTGPGQAVQGRRRGRVRGSVGAASGADEGRIRGGHGVDGEAAGEGHGDVAGAGGTSEPARVEVMGGDNAGTHDSNPGAHGEGPVAAVETGEGGKVRDEGARGLLGTTDGNRGAREAVGTGHGVTASNVDVDLVSAYSTGTETTSRNTARGRAPSSGYTGISRREGKWAARLCLDNNWYTEVLDAAKAFAAAAHICRPSISSSKMVRLSVEER